MNGDDKKYFEKLLDVHAAYLGQKINSVNFNMNEKIACLQKKVEDVLPKIREHSEFIRTVKIVFKFVGTIIAGIIVYIVRDLIIGKK